MIWPTDPPYNAWGDDPPPDSECECEPYEMDAPCPDCFESSGYHHRIVSGGYYEPDWAEADPCNPCETCCGTGLVDALELGPDDFANDVYDDGYVAALDVASAMEMML